MDILIFGGQSNMQGQTESLPPVETPLNGIWEYRHFTHSLKPIAHPVGEDIGNFLLAAHEGHGSLLPDFCKAYRKECSHDVVAIHVSKGATTIAEWLPDNERYNVALDKIKGGIKAAEEHGPIGHIFYIWLQGESDALTKTTGRQYLRQLTEYKNALKRDVPIELFGIIRVGYFTQNAEYDREIMHAQDVAASTDKDFCMLTRICERLSLDTDYINPYAAGHYNNAGMKLIGESAGEVLGRIAKGKQEK